MIITNLQNWRIIHYKLLTLQSQLQKTFTKLILQKHIPLQSFNRLRLQYITGLIIYNSKQIWQQSQLINLILKRFLYFRTISHPDQAHMLSKWSNHHYLLIMILNLNQYPLGYSLLLWHQQMFGSLKMINIIQHLFKYLYPLERASYLIQRHSRINP